MHTPLRAALTALTGATLLLVVSCSSSPEAALSTAVSVTASPWVKPLESSSPSSIEAAIPPTSTGSTAFSLSSGAISPSGTDSPPSDSVVGSSSTVSQRQTVSEFTPMPLPAGLNSEQVSEAQAAIEVFGKYRILIDEVISAPAIDRSGAIAELAEGTAADSLRSAQAQLKDRNLHAIGTTQGSITITNVEPGVVSLQSCVDASGQDLVDGEGHSYRRSDGPGSYYRFISSVQVAKFADGRWRVVVDSTDRSAQC